MSEKLSEERYKELKYFCLQYKDKKSIANINNAAGRKAKADIYMIEHTAAVIYPEISKYLVESVSTGKTWEQISPPCGRRQFYNARRRFFYLLSEYK